jgi:hypothetical protein
MLPLVVHMPAVTGKPGRPKCKPKMVVADKAFDCEALRGIALARHRALLPKRCEDEHGLGIWRWFVERPSVGFTNSDDYASARIAGLKSIKRFWHLRPQSSAIDSGSMKVRFVPGSKTNTLSSHSSYEQTEIGPLPPQ